MKQKTKVKDLPFSTFGCSPDFSSLKQRMELIELFRQAFSMTQLELSTHLKTKYSVDVSQVIDHHLILGPFSWSLGILYDSIVVNKIVNMNEISLIF